MIREKLKEIIEKNINLAISEGRLGAMVSLPSTVIVDRPRLPEHGDFACGVALKLAASARMSPLEIAELLARYISNDSAAAGEFISSVRVAPPGFINFHLSAGWLNEALLQIHQQAESFGKTNLGAGKKVLIEYVSANPTGELHIGHGRNAVYGSCLANLLKFVGYKVDQEFYVNDTGEQIAQLMKCAWSLYQRRLGKSVPYPESGYPEDILSEFVDEVIKKHKDEFLYLSDELGEARLGELTMKFILDGQRNLLEKLRVHFDNWFSERSLHASNKVTDALQQFERNSMSFESEGALWLKAKLAGDERDRVLRKSSGYTTYLANDSAYHLDKFERGYQLLVNVWGADHHGQVPGLKAAVQALGRDANQLEIILTQIVNLSRDGRIVRMSKRKGTVVTLAEVIDEVGVDAVRYYLAESNPQNPINFDLELAKRTSCENPAFYIQYAHARCCAILRKALEPSANAELKQIDPPTVSKSQWEEFQQQYKSSPQVFQALYDSDPQIFSYQKALIMRLESFPEEVVEAALTRLPGRLARYAYELANDLQKFYEESRVITENLPVTKARLGLIKATRQVLANVLAVMDVSAPEKM